MKEIEKRMEGRKKVERKHGCKHFSAWFYKSVLPSCFSDNVAINRNQFLELF